MSPGAQIPKSTPTKTRKLSNWLVAKHFGFKNVELLTIVMVTIVGGFFTSFMIHRRNNNLSDAPKRCDTLIYNQYGVCMPPQPEYLGDNHDINVTKDLNTIDTDVNNYFSNNYGPLDYTINGNISNVSISGLNYPISNYVVTNISYGLGPDGSNLKYKVCTKFDTDTDTSSNVTSSNYEDSFNIHGKGAWCFDVNDNDGPDSSITGSRGSH